MKKETVENEEKFDGYYSAKQANLVGFSIYRDMYGNSFLVTEVVNAGNPPNSKWDDLLFVGKVSTHIKSYKGKTNRTLFAKNYEDYR